MPGYYKNRVHPASCKCRMCRKKRKTEKQEYRFLASTFWFIVFIMIAIF